MNKTLLFKTGNKRLSKSSYQLIFSGRIPVLEEQSLENELSNEEKEFIVGGEKLAVAFQNISAACSILVSVEVSSVEVFLNKQCGFLSYSTTCWFWHWSDFQDLDISPHQPVHSLNPSEFYMFSSRVHTQLPFCFIYLYPCHLSASGDSLFTWTEPQMSASQISRVTQYAQGKCVCFSPGT